MNLEATISIYTGGQGSGCRGEDCGRKRGEKILREISKMSLDTADKGIVTPEGKIFFGYGGVEHADLREKAGYENYDNFYDNGGIRFGIVPGGSSKEMGFVEIHKKDTERIRKALTLLSLFPTLEVSFDFVSGKDSKHFEGSPEKVMEKVRAWGTS